MLWAYGYCGQLSEVQGACDGGCNIRLRKICSTAVCEDYRFDTEKTIPRWLQIIGSRSRAKGAVTYRRGHLDQYSFPH